MEAYAILTVAKTYDAIEKVIVIKSVSDGADSQAAKAHIDNLSFAMGNALAILDFSL
jgi:nucleoside phosphorylase